MFISRIVILLIAAILPVLGLAQAIEVKTMPLISATQFALAPSYNAGMAGISIALDDTLADAFTNPARLSGIKDRLYFASYYQDSWSERSVDWRSPTHQGSMVQGLPTGLIAHSKRGKDGRRISLLMATSREYLRHRSHTLQFWNRETGENNGAMQMGVMQWPFTASIAVDYPEKGLAVGVGIDAVELHGVDGIALLYPGAVELRQDGQIRQYRLGVSLDRPKDSRIDLLLLHKRYHMNQHAVYEWEPDIHNKDGERSWLVQFKGHLPPADQVQLALELTGQYKWHPKIPDFPSPEIRIPRDPGITRAVRIGVGLSDHHLDRIVTAIDLAVEIIDTRTWGDTTANVSGFGDKVIKAGDPLFSNDYFFTNAIIRFGGEYHLNEILRVQAGWSTKEYSLDYYHEDFVTGEKIVATPQNWWREGATTFGFVARLGQMEWIFQSIKRTGMGIPSANQGRNWWGGGWRREVSMAGGDLLAPPTGLDFSSTPLVMHRLTLIYRF